MPKIAQLVADEQVRIALDSLAEHRDALVDLAVSVQQIPAPTFAEQQRATYIEEKFTALGLESVRQDEIGNVIGCMPGKQLSLAPLVVSAHSDTVFPSDTDLTVRYEGDRVYGPGIADNSTGVAGLLTLAATMVRYNLKPQRTIWFVCNVGEEGLGDLHGMRVITDLFEHASAFIVLEGGMYGYLLHEAIGVKRYRVTVASGGGHSWSDFGRVSAIHLLGRVIAKIDGIRVPQSPKTTYNVGVIEGGTSINTIASSASLLLDLRSEEPGGLDYLVTQLNAIVDQTRREHSEASITVEKIGDRPAGKVERSEPLVQMADAALRWVGCTQITYLRGSTDANIPLSRGLPAVCIGLARSANAHRTDEYLDTRCLHQGMQQLLLLTLQAANTINNSDSAASKRKVAADIIK